MKKLKHIFCESFTIVAVDRSTSKPIAMTEIWNKFEAPDVANQSDTGVIFEHRGKKLGLTLKYQMLDYLLTSEGTKNVKLWSTGNAASNKHMLAINDELNYKEDGIWKVFYLSTNLLREKAK